MKKAFEEGWGAVIAKTVSIDSSKVRYPFPVSLHTVKAKSSDMWNPRYSYYSFPWAY